MHATSITRFGGVFVALVLLVTMFLPMVAIHLFGVMVSEERGVPAGEVTVGIAVFLRATARRLLRGASTNFMRTTVGAFGRTSARAATRRFVKFSGRLLFSSVVQQSTEEAGTDEATKERSELLLQVVALALGFVGLCVSFWGILQVVDADTVAGILGTSGLSELSAVVLAGVPLLVYALLHYVFGKVFDVRTRYRTELDGLLLQGYFTGAGSFLPLTTDVDYTGSDIGKRNVAIASLVGMLVAYGGIALLGNATGSAELSFLGPMFLVYAFVYCFPIKPLEGHFIWTSSKTLWAVITTPILIAFMLWLPEGFGQIL